MTILQCYAPTNDAEDEIKDEWYEQLQKAVAKVPAHDMLLVIGDMNAKVGNDNTSYERAMGKEGCGEMNENGERLVDFCMKSQLCHRWHNLCPQGYTQTYLEITRLQNT